jgi:hypothetical protein
MDEELGNENRFFVSKDASGNPVYTHNNEVVSKDVYDRRSQASTNQMNELKNRVIPGIDDDPDIMAMKAKLQAMKKPIKKAQGGTVSSASKRGDGIAQRGKTRGKMC